MFLKTILKQLVLPLFTFQWISCQKRQQNNTLLWISPTLQTSSHYRYESVQSAVFRFLTPSISLRQHTHSNTAFKWICAIGVRNIGLNGEGNIRCTKHAHTIIYTKSMSHCDRSVIMRAILPQHLSRVLSYLTSESTYCHHHWPENKHVAVVRRKFNLSATSDKKTHTNTLVVHAGWTRNVPYPSTFSYNQLLNMVI